MVELRELGRIPEQIEIEILSGVVRKAGRYVETTPREFEVLAALAVQRLPRTAEWLADFLTSSDDLVSRKAAIKVYIHRLRAKLGSASIATIHGSYTLGETVSVDVWQLHRTIAGASRPSRSPSAEQAIRVANAALQLLRDRPESVSKWDWFSATNAMLTHAAVDAAVSVAWHLYNMSAVDEAREVALALLERDTCNESAYEILIRLMLARGDRGSANRFYAMYRAAMATELEIAPSPKLRALLETKV